MEGGVIGGAEDGGYVAIGQVEAVMKSVWGAYESFG
jgi:hypothetical protein